MINEIKIGDIVLFKDVIFSGKYKNFDHYSLKGRPCVLVGIDKNEENYYFIPLSSKLHNYKHKKCIIYPTPQNKLKKASYPEVPNIIQRHQCFYEVNGFLSDEELYLIFVNIVKYFKTYDACSNAQLIVEQAKKFIEKYYVSHVNQAKKL